MGYNAATRRTVSVSVNGGAYDERNLIGVGYVIEQATHLRQQASAIDLQRMYRCAATVPPEPFAGRGHCNPSYTTIMKMLGAEQRRFCRVLARNGVGAEPRIAAGGEDAQRGDVLVRGAYP